MEVLNHVLVVKKDNLKMFLSTICHIGGFLVLSRSRWTLFQALFFLFLCLFLSSLKRLKPMETFSKQLIFSFKCLLNITDRNLYEKIVNRIKAKMWSYLGYCFHFSEVGLRESLLAVYLISLLPIID